MSIKKLIFKVWKNILHFSNKFDIIHKAMRNASVAQSVEQLIRNQQVAGPNPATSSKLLTLTKGIAKRCLLYFIRNFSLLPLPHSTLSNQRYIKLLLSFRVSCGGDTPFHLMTVFDREYLLIKLSGSPQNSIVLWGEQKVADPNPAHPISRFVPFRSKINDYKIILNKE